MQNLEIYCVTNKKLDFLEQTPFKLVGVGEDNFSEKYLKCNTRENIYYKEKYYSELTFHYWYWKNILPTETKNGWASVKKEDFGLNLILTKKLYLSKILINFY